MGTPSISLLNSTLPRAKAGGGSSCRPLQSRIPSGCGATAASWAMGRSQTGNDLILLLFLEALFDLLCSSPSCFSHPLSKLERGFLVGFGGCF